ncbi:uncharacterized protein ACR2FA_005425 [Aphomia sociella]
MSGPTELSFDEILKFMLAHNGKVTNHELVKHFKVFLMNPDMRDEARTTFKKHVNSLAIIKNQNNEKWLILKKKYMTNNVKDNEEANDKKTLDSSAGNLSENHSEPERNPVPYCPPPPVQLNQDFSILNNIIQDTTMSQNKLEIDSSESGLKECLESTSKENCGTIIEDVPPKVYPRRKSSDKTCDKRSSLGQTGQRSSIPNQDTSAEETTLTSCRSESMLIDNEQKISVKERKQMFNRMASESDVLKVNKIGGNFNIQGVDEEDRVSLDQKSENEPLDSKQKQWILCAVRGEYHALAKMCKENAKLAKTKFLD